MGALTMTKQEREAFLAGTHIGVLAVDGGADGAAPIITPIWYSYEPGGDVVFSTGAASDKTAALRRTGRASLCVQTETAPYQYVVVEGSATVTDGVDQDWRRDCRAQVSRRLRRRVHRVHEGRTGHVGHGASRARALAHDRLRQAVLKIGHANDPRAALLPPSRGSTVPVSHLLSTEAR